MRKAVRRRLQRGHVGVSQGGGSRRRELRRLARCLHRNNPTCSVSGEGPEGRGPVRRMDNACGPGQLRGGQTDRGSGGAFISRTPRSKRPRGRVRPRRRVRRNPDRRAPRALKPPAGVTLWIVPNLNPDGYATGATERRRRRPEPELRRAVVQRHESDRQRRVSGQRPFSEPETRIVRDLILRLRPSTTVWYFARTPGATTRTRASRRRTARTQWSAAI